MTHCFSSHNSLQLASSLWVHYGIPVLPVTVSALRMHITCVLWRVFAVITQERFESYYSQRALISTLFTHYSHLFSKHVELYPREANKDTLIYTMRSMPHIHTSTHTTAPPSYFLGSAVVQKAETSADSNLCALVGSLFVLIDKKRKTLSSFSVLPFLLYYFLPFLYLICHLCQSKETFSSELMQKSAHILCLHE